MTEARPRLTVGLAGTATVVRLNDERMVGDEVIHEVRNQLYALAAATPSPRLVLDLSAIRGYSSEFLGNLIGLNRRLIADGGSLRLCALGPELRDAIGILHLDRIFAISETLEAALAEPS